jgi:hypothetical protein
MCNDIPSAPREWRVRAEPVVVEDRLTCGNCGLGDQRPTLPLPTLKGDGSFQYSCPCGAVHGLTSKRLARECDELREIFASLQADEKENKRTSGENVPMECPVCGEALRETCCQKCGWDPQEPAITLGESRQIAHEIQEGTADPADARRLLDAFCQCVEHGRTPPSEIMEYLSIALRAHLGGKAIEAALGLTRREGAPSKIGLHQWMALNVLELRLAGLRSGEAIACTANAPGAIREESAVKGAWAKYQRDALLELRHRRAASGEQWTGEEFDRLERIFRRGSVLHRCPKCGTRKFADNHDTMCPASGWHPPLSLSDRAIA